MPDATPKFAWFIMVHHKPAQFEWLMNALYAPGDLYLVHVDAKSRLGLKADRRGVMQGVRRVMAGRPNITLMRSRFTNWGGWSLSQVLLDAIRLALRRDPDWSHFVNLSGQCYPLKPVAEIKRQIAAAGDRVHVELLPIVELPADDWHRDASAMFETPVRALKLRRAPAPRGFSIDHKGSQWVVLPRAFCEWLVTAPLTRKVTRYLQRRLLSDELILQTLAVSGPYRDRVAGHYGREIIWPGPRVLTAADLPRLQATSSWFGRKFDVAVDADVLLALATANGFTPGPSNRPA